MRSLVMGVSLLALMAPTAYAQQAQRPAAPQSVPPHTAPRPAPQPATPAQAEAAKFLVFFDWDKSALTPEGRRIVASAADEFKKTGSTRIVATGHTDLSGSPQYNQRLSERRADAVKAELIRLGVPATVITTIGKGEEDPLVPTKDGVREAQNRRVEIVIPRPPKPAEPAKPVTAAPPPLVPPPPAPLKWEASLGPWYGYNIKEKDKDPGEHQKSSNLLGPELRLGYSITPNWVLFADGVLFNTIGTSADDGWGGRGVGGFHHQWNLGALHPFIGPHAGYIFGKGVEDGAIIGPEIGVNYDVSRNMFLYARAAYDHNFRNDLDQGIANGGIGAGFRW
jgi:outer membrane protein OmpA-like peptidoglycan-associated protein